ncbi:MAG TPA: DUF3368 domain-containing protein [Salinarimonas sp.]|nr:DUF3368 domain-containing protein [Salinarimonas sp.]
MPDEAPVIVADTGPLHYLVLIGHIDVLPRLFGRVAVPAAVIGELRHANAPAAVRAWVSELPPWVSIHSDPAATAAVQSRLGAGERAALALADTLSAALLLMDDRAGTTMARNRGFEAVGTVGLLMRAAGARLLDLKAAFAALRATNFRHSPALLDALLAEHRAREGTS